MAMNDNFKQEARSMTKEGFQEAMSHPYGQDREARDMVKNIYRDYEEYPSYKFLEQRDKEQLKKT